MKVIVSIAGRGSTFYLVQQLLKRGYLRQLITSYPKFEVKKYGIPPDLVDSILIKEILERGWRRLPSFLRKAFDPSYFIHETFDKRAAKKLRGGDIIWTWTASALHTIRAARRKGITTIVEIGNAHPVYQEDLLEEEYRRFNAPFSRRPRKSTEKMLREYEETDYISVPSLYVKRTFVEAGIPESKIICVPYGVNLNEFKQISKTDDVFRVIFVGGVSLRKGVHYLLQAFSELNLPNSELLLIGAMNDEIKPLLKKYEGKYRWLGHIPQKELYKYYSQSSVFVLDSLDDGFGIVVAQAMSCGLPVIVSENTGGGDLIEDGREGFIVPIRDAEALKKKLLFLYENPKQARAMGKAALHKMESGFTWDHYGDTIVDTFKRLLWEKGKSSSPA